jgi:hypothetical protein
LDAGDGPADYDGIESGYGGIAAGYSTYVFNQCFSGGILDSLQTGPTVFGAAASSHYELSYSDYFCAAFTAALANGYGSTHDAFGFAFGNDSRAEVGGPGGDWRFGVEHPWSAGGEFAIFNLEPANPAIQFTEVIPLKMPPPANRSDITYDLLLAALDAADPTRAFFLDVHYNPGPPKVVDGFVNDTPGRTGGYPLTSISVTFNENVDIDAEALKLREDATGSDTEPAAAEFGYVEATCTANWSWNLPDIACHVGHHTVILDAADVTDADGNPLDGNGDGTGGDDFTCPLIVGRRGDADLDGDVDIRDFNVLATNFDPLGSNGPANTWLQGNFDGDLDVDILDFNLLGSNFAPSATTRPRPQALMHQ